MKRSLPALLFLAVAACGVDLEPDPASGDDLALAPHAIPPGQHRAHIVFAGSGAGRLEIFAGSTYLQSCERTCNIDVPDGTQLYIDVYAPSQFAGFTGACTTTDFECVVTMTSNVTVTAELEFDDREVATLLPEETINGVAFAADGNLIAATTTGLSKYRLDGKVAWTTPLDGGATGVVTDVNGRIFATSGDHVFALSPAGAVLWTQPVAVFGPERNLYSMIGPVQIDPAGTMIAVRTGGGVATFRRDGTPRFHTDDGYPDGMAVAPDGTVAFGVPDPEQPDQLDLRRYSAAGALLPPPAFVPGDDHASLAYDARGNLGSFTSAFSHVLAVLSPTLDYVWGIDAPLRDFTEPQGIAFDSGGNLIAVYVGDGGTNIDQYTPTGELQFQAVKSPPGPWAFPAIPVAIASDRGKRIAVAGEINFRPWISVYQLP